MSTFSYNISTMGCKANLTDSQSIERRLQAIGGIPAQTNPDLFVLNTCTVTDAADREAEYLLKKSPGKATLITGCLAEVDPQRLESISKKLGKKVLVTRNSGKRDLGLIVSEWLQSNENVQLHIGDRSSWHNNVDHLVGAAAISDASADLKTRGFIKVQDGCNAFCSYCIIPFARGRSRSLTKEEIKNEVESVLKAGLQEVVLTAIHAADYEDPNQAGFDFFSLVKYLLAETAIPRLRLTSLDPAEIPSKLIDLMTTEPRLCPHFHISLQSASDSVLVRMKRGYNCTKASDCLNEIGKKLPHAFVGMDMITGFPGETDTEFSETFDFLQTHPWTKLHVFPFSIRKNTYAAKLIEQGLAVENKLIHARAKMLRELSEVRMANMLRSRVGSLMEVLTEYKKVKRSGELFSTGYTRSYHRVLLKESYEPNQLIRVKINSSETDYLFGEIV